MSQLVRAYGSIIVPLGALALVLAILTVAAVLGAGARRRAVARRLLRTWLLFSVVALLLLTLTPVSSGRSINLTPFAGLAQGGVSAGEVAANVVLFCVPSALLPAAVPTFRRLHALVMLAVVVSVAVEALQYALGVGRASDVTDVLVNTAGAVAGWLVWRITVRRVPAHSPRRAVSV